MKSSFFLPKKNIKLSSIFPEISKKKDFIISEIKPLQKAKKNDVSFFDSIKYKTHAKQLQEHVLPQKNLKS